MLRYSIYNHYNENQLLFVLHLFLTNEEHNLNKIKFSFSAGTSTTTCEITNRSTDDTVSINIYQVSSFTALKFAITIAVSLIKVIII
jgi:hypothetical protein